MLQRIYGAMFPTQAELDEYLDRLEEAERRDHRRLGRELDLFYLDPIAPGRPFFLPKGGTCSTTTLVDFIRDLYPKYGYQEVITPQIFDTDLLKTSGHYDNYRDNMYFIEDDDRELGVKPMNCPGHCLLYAQRAALVPRAAAALRRLRPPAPLRALRHAARPDARALVLAGRRAHLLHARPGSRARSRASSR